MLIRSDHCNPLRLHLARPGVRRPRPIAHRGEDHQAPPEALQEAPLTDGVSLCEVDQAGEGENTDEEEAHEEAELLVGLAEGDQQALQPIEVSDELQHNTPVKC